jgi:hypothetical protein
MIAKSKCPRVQGALCLRGQEPGRARAGAVGGCAAAPAWPGRFAGTKKPTPTTELAPASLPVWLVPLLLRLRLRQAVALVLYIDGDLGQRLGVLATMVRTEKQLS